MGPSLYRRTVVTREIEDGRNLLDVLPSLGPRARRELLGRVAAEVRRFHEAGIYPADLTLGNVVNSGGTAFIVDLDKPALRNGRDADLDAHNLGRFLRDYLGGAWCLRDLCRPSRRGLWRQPRLVDG